MKRAIIYARVSTDEQAEKGYSISTQLEAMREYAERNSFKIVDEITDDCSGSIPVANRPGGSRVYQYLKSKRTDAVILYTIDRTARDKHEYPIEYLIFVRDVEDAGAELFYVDTGKSSGGIVDIFKAWQAGEERKKILERSLRGRVAKAKEGKWVGEGYPPYGYRKVGKQSETYLEIYEPEAKIIRRIFAMYTGIGEKRQTVLAIAALLEKEGVPSPGNYGRGDRWYHSTLRRFVRNCDYIGVFHHSHNKITINLPELAIVSPEIWEAAQRQTQKNREMAKRNNKKYEYLLRSRLKCNCGLRLVGVPIVNGGKLYRYYACGRYRGDRHVYDCKEKYLHVEDTDKLVWSWLYSLTDDDDKLMNGIENWQRQNADQANEKKTRLESLNQIVSRAERSVARLAVAYRKAENDYEAEALERERKIAEREN